MNEVMLLRKDEVLKQYKWQFLVDQINQTLE